MPQKQEKTGKKAQIFDEKPPQVLENPQVFGDLSSKGPQTADIFARFAQDEPDRLRIPLVAGEKPAGVTVENLDIAGELGGLYKSAKDLLDSVLTDSDVPTNQRAQVLNSVSALIQQIAKTRTEVYTAERLRKLEQALIRTLYDISPELKEQFMADYERALAESDVS